MVNDVLAATTIITIISIVLETVPALYQYERIFRLIEWTAVVIFTFEYVLRLWAAPRRRDYAFSSLGIIDFLAIAPTYLGLGNFSFLKSARIVRVIRFLRLARTTKLSHLNVKDAEETLGIYGFNLALYAVTLTFAMLLLGVSLHILVSNDAGIYWSVPSGMLWAFKIFLGIVYVPVPEGTVGLIIYMVAKFCGLVLFGLLVGVVGKIFNQMLLGKRAGKFTMGGK